MEDKLIDETKNLIIQRNFKVEARIKTPKNRVKIAKLQKSVKRNDKEGLAPYTI